jgi:hypothetical protein
MYNDYAALKMHKVRERELLQEAREYRLAKLARGPQQTLAERLRAVLSSINTKLYLSPANKGLDCVLLPSAC